MKEPVGTMPAVEPSSLRLFRSGFYWLSALHDARNIVQHCEACQGFATKPHAPASELHTIPVAWPFTQWGLDQVGRLPKSSRGSHTYLLVAMDKFSKWIKVVPVTNQEATTVVKFFDSIVYQYGVPNSIITDNGTNFTSGEFQEFAKELHEKTRHPVRIRSNQHESHTKRENKDLPCKESRAVYKCCCRPFSFDSASSRR
jgi:transposase InsO family protein